MIPTFGARTMSHSITIETTDKPKERKGTPLTNELCEKKVKTLTKRTDSRTRGLHVKINPKGIATFHCAYTKADGKPTSAKIGTYNRETFNVAHARAEVAALKAKGAKAIGETVRRKKAHTTKMGITVDQLIEKHIAFLKAPTDGTAPNKSWPETARHLRTLVGPRLGHMIANDVTDDDIAELQNAIVAGNFVGKNGRKHKASLSTAKHMRTAAKMMFKWAMIAGSKFVEASPVVNLPRLGKLKARGRVLSEDEIRTLWHGLDLMPHDRQIKLAIRFALCSMLRSNELLPLCRTELDFGNRVANIPAIRVKKNRVINAPLSCLALEIITEAMGDNEFAFVGRFGDKELSRQAMSAALRGSTVRADGTKKTYGICELLGVKPFTPHDLRRTAATHCRRMGLSRAIISLCLDHRVTEDDDGNALPSVTDKHYTDDDISRIAEKRPVLDAWAVELRRIIAEPAATELRLAA
jgi:integrase